MIITITENKKIIIAIIILMVIIVTITVVITILVVIVVLTIIIYLYGFCKNAELNISYDGTIINFPQVCYII